MKKMHLFVLITILLLTSGKVYCQVVLPGSIQYLEGDSYQDPVKSIYHSWDGKGLSPIGTFRCLNIFINIIYDQAPATNPINESNTYEWPRADLESVNQYTPSYLSDFTDSEYSGPNSVSGFQTRLMYESSFGNFIVLGDFIVVNIKQSTITPTYTNHPYGADFNRNTLVNKAIDLINNNGGLSTIFGHDLISDYDINYVSGDGTADFTQIFLRNTRITDDYNHGDLNAGSGYGGLPDTYYIDASGGNRLKTSKGTIQCVGQYDLSMESKIVTHELCHSLFGDNSFHTSGGNHYGTSTAVSSIGLQGGYGLMGCAGSSLTSCNGYERWRMHWKSSTYNTSTYYIAANNVNSDIQKSDGNKTFIIRDFVATGDAVRIKLPYKDNSNCSNQYIWLENHQVGNNNKIDYLRYSNTNDCRNQGTAGIYAYIQIGRDVLESTSNLEVWPGNETDNLKQITAEGNWDMTLMQSSTYDCVAWSPSPTARTEMLNLENPFMGYNDLQYHFFDATGTTQTLCSNNGDFSWKKYYNTTKYNDSLPFLGDIHDAFTGTMSIGVGTNPSTCNLATYYLTQGNGVFTPSSEIKNNYKVYLSGLKITMTDLNNGTFQVTVVWDDYNVNNDVRWTGDIILKEQLNLTQGKIIILDQNYTPYTIYKQPVTNLFARTTTLTCENGSYFHQLVNSEVVVNNGSTININQGAEYVIDNNSELIIKSGCSLFIDDCAKLIINGNGKLTVESGGSLSISDGAILDFENGQQNLNLTAGYIVPTGYIDPIDYVPPYTIISSNNETWTNKTYFVRNISILQNAKLTIQDSKLIFTDASSKLLINATGTFLLDNSTLTSNGCNNSVWQGIEVWGNNTHHQFTISGNCYQGTVILENGAIIENALNAINAIKMNVDSTSDWSTTGGIIKADGAIFRNNKNGVWLGAYHNFNPNNPSQKLPNTSYFYNCYFETTDAYNMSMGYPYEFIGLYDVEGIRIYGNTFQNLNTSMSSNNRGNGIMSYDVSYTANALCSNPYTIPCPLAQQTPNNFTNLYYAINSSNINSAKSVQINNNNFTNNAYAIVLQGIDGARITKNVINHNGGISAGIYLDNCSGYKVEENTFNNGFAGIVVNNSGASDNEIYNNIFNHTIRSCQAQGINGDQSWLQSGLQFKCNEFNNNNPTYATDIAVTSGSIKPKQGFCSSDTKTPAGNIFTFYTLCNKQLYKNPAAYSFTYNYHPGAGGTQPSSYSSGITPNPCTGSIYDPATSCPSKLNTGYTSMQLIANINNGKSRLTPMYSMFDNGNTQTLLDEVINNSNTAQVTTLLSGASPYLTDTVMLAALGRTNALSPAQIETVFIPNSPLTSKVYGILNTISLPPGTQIKIANAQTGVSARSVLEQQISQINDTIYTAENQLMQYYLSDTTGILLDSLRLYLLDNINPVNQQRLVKVYLSQQNYTDAKNILDSIQQKTAADSNFVTFYNLLSDVFISGRTLFELDSIEKLNVVNVAAAKTFVSRNAEALLSLVYGERFPLNIEKLITDDSLSIRGYLKYDSVCSGIPAAGDTLVVLGADTVRINSISSVIADSAGYFLFYFPELLTLSDTTVFGFGTTDGTPVKDFELKTLSQWVAASPLNLTFRKTEADFIFDTIICYNDSVHFTSIITGGKKPYTYHWDFGNDSVSTSPNPAMLYDTTGTYNVMLVVSSADGCTDTMNKDVIINPLPEITITTSNSAICIGDSATMTASGGASYLWNTSDTSAVMSFAPDLTTTYTVTVTSAEGCSNTASSTITVNSLPSAVINSSDSTICAGDSVTLTASGGATYLWNTADTAEAIIVVPDSTTTYTVTVTDAEGCNASNNVTVTTICANITGRTMYAGKANPGTAPYPPTYNSRIYDINKEIVILKNQSGAEIARDTSDADGAFNFSSVYNGNYTLVYDKYTADTMQWCDHVNSVDLSLILYYIANDTNTDPSRNFSRIYKKAADVDNNGTVNSVDKARIQAKVAYPNNTTYNFPKGNWVNLDTTITVNSSDLNITIPVISYGDYNASSSKYKDSANTWSQVKAFKDENVIFISDESIIINNSGLIEIPLRISSSLNDFSAMGLELFYTKEQFKLVSASMPNTSDSNGVLKINPTLQEIIDNNNDLLVTDDSGIIRVVFATTNIFDVAGNDIMIYLGFLPLTELEQGELDFKLFGTGIIADQYGDEAKAYEFLLMPQIFVQGNHGEDGFEFAGYPNPFKGDATLSYNLPENGMVKLSVYNTLGVCISELVNEAQMAGKHNVVFTPKNFGAGMYTFQLDYTGEQNSHCAVLKMIHK